MLEAKTGFQGVKWWMDIGAKSHNSIEIQVITSCILG